MLVKLHEHKTHKISNFATCSKTVFNSSFLHLGKKWSIDIPIVNPVLETQLMNLLLLETRIRQEEKHLEIL